MGRSGRPISDPPPPAGLRPAGAWKEIKVFISSTFRDMHQERDFLMHLLEGPSRIALARRQHLVPLDLRWGVSTAGQSARELAVLQICLEHVAKSDGMIVLLGERYGYVPPESSLKLAIETCCKAAIPSHVSITAAEILVGALSRPRQAHAVFLFRDVLNSSDQPANASDHGYLDTPLPDVDHRHKLDMLKKEIRDTFPGRCKSYPAVWTKQGDQTLLVVDRDGFCANAERLSRQLLDELAPEIDERVAGAKEDDAGESLRASVSAHLHAIGVRESSGAEAIPVPSGLRVHAAVLEKMESFATSASGSVCCLLGESGAGKSVLVSRLLACLWSKAKILVLAHRATIGPRSTDPLALLRRWCRELRARLQWDPLDDITWDVSKLRKQLQALLAQAAKTERIVLVVDGLDQMDSRHECRDWIWLPTTLPANVCLLVASTPFDTSEILSGAESLTLPGLADDDVNAITRAMCDRYRKQTDPRVNEAICQHAFAAGEPPRALGVSLRVERLLIFDEKDFAAAARRKLPGEDQIVAEQLEVVTSLPPRLEDLSKHLIERACSSLAKDFGAIWIHDLLRLVAVSRAGLRSLDVRNILRIEGHEHDVAFTWALLLLRSHLTDRAGVIEFLHPGLRRHVVEGLGAEARLEANRSIAGRLTKLDTGDNFRWDIMRHWLVAEEPEQARIYLGGKVDKAELVAAAQTLADHVVDGEADGTSLGFVGRMLISPCRSVEDEHAVRRLVFNLVPLLAERTRLETREALLTACTRSLEGYLATQGPHIPPPAHEEHPDPRAETQRDLSEALRQQVDVQQKLGNYQAAVSCAERALAVAQELHETAPAWKDGYHAVVLSHIALAKQLNDKTHGAQAERARQHYVDALDVSDTLARQYPEDNYAQLLRVHVGRTLGKFMAGLGPDYADDAAAAYGEVTKLAAEVLAGLGSEISDLGLALRREILTLQLERTAWLLSRKDLDWELFEIVLGDARKVLEDLKRDQPRNQELLHEEARLTGREGDYCHRRGKEAQAIAAWQRAVACLLHVLEIDPSDGQAMSDLQAVRARLAGVHEPPLLN
jgi:tetratricopeptide (TPR) repeat protein